MSVSLRFAPTSLGRPYTLPQNAGTLSPAGQSSVINTYISHDGTANITNSKFYILPYTGGVYLGATTAQDDYDSILSWGDVSYPAVLGGGLYINQNASGGFPDSSWDVFRTGHGDSLGNAITLSANAIISGSAIAGVIQPSTGEAQVRWRIDIPASHSATGISYIDTTMYYEATS